MHAECNYLRNVIFPELEESLKERRHTLEPIDLRRCVDTMNLDNEHGNELLVLKVCLTEIELRRPFLIALLGDRNGWTLPEKFLASAAQEAGFSSDVRQKKYQRTGN